MALTREPTLFGGTLSRLLTQRQSFCPGGMRKGSTTAFISVVAPLSNQLASPVLRLVSLVAFSLNRRDNHWLVEPPLVLRLFQCRLLRKSSWGAIKRTVYGPSSCTTLVAECENSPSGFVWNAIRRIIYALLLCNRPWRSAFAKPTTCPVTCRRVS